MTVPRTESPSDARIPAWAGLAARLAVGLVLVVSGTFKASAPAEEFSVVIEAYGLVPPDMSLTLAACLPWLELWVGFALICGYLTRLTSLAAEGMFLAFIGAILSTKIRGIELPDCGCFGGGFDPKPNVTLLMDAGFAFLAYLSFKKGGALWSMDNWALEAQKS